MNRKFMMTFHFAFFQRGVLHTGHDMLTVEVEGKLEESSIRNTIDILVERRQKLGQYVQKGDFVLINCTELGV